MNQLRQKLLFLVALIILSSLASQIVTPIWPLYIKSLGASMTELGLVFALSNSVIALLMIPSGWLSDKYGRRVSNTAGSLIMMFPPLLYTIARSWTDLIPWVILSSVAQSLYIPARETMVADESTTKNRAVIYGLSNMALYSGIIGGPVIGGLIADGYGLKMAFFPCSILFCLCVPLAVMIKGTTPKIRSASQEVIPNEPIQKHSFQQLVLWFSLINIVDGIGFGNLIPITPVFLETHHALSRINIGLIYTISGIAMIGGQFPAGRLADKYERKKIYIFGKTIAAFSCIMFALSRNFIELLVFRALLYGINEGAWPALQAWRMDVTPRTKWGLMNGIMNASFMAGNMIGSVFSGILWDNFGVCMPFYVAALTIFLQAAIAATYYVRERTD